MGARLKRTLQQGISTYRDAVSS